MSYSHNNPSDLIDLGIYLKSIKDVCKVISSEEESELVRRMQLGDETARERLIKANLGFVIHIAKEYAGYGLTHMELISEGNMGLIEATYRFNEKKGYRFVSYAVWWIRNFILSTLAQHSRTIRVPDNRISQLGKISKILTQFDDEDPLNHLEEITRELETTPKSIEELLISTQEVESLDKPNGNGDYDDQSLYDTTQNTTEKSPEETTLEEIGREELSSVLHKLPGIEEEVLRLYFGIGGQGPFTLEEIGKMKGELTRARICQIKNKALERLRHPCRVEKLREFY